MSSQEAKPPRTQSFLAQDSSKGSTHPRTTIALRTRTNNSETEQKATTTSTNYLRLDPTGSGYGRAGEKRHLRLYRSFSRQVSVIGFIRKLIIWDQSRKSLLSEKNLRSSYGGWNYCANSLLNCWVCSRSGLTNA